MNGGSNLWHHYDKHTILQHNRHLGQPHAGLLCQLDQLQKVLFVSVTSAVVWAMQTRVQSDITPSPVSTLGTMAVVAAHS